MTGTAIQSMLWFIAILAMIPAALWLLKRTPLGGQAATNGMRVVSALPLSASQRIVTVEVGSGEERRWLVLGVTPSTITTLHTLSSGPDGGAAAHAAAAPATPFAQILGKLKRPGGGDGT